jgi:hypothetical protein
MANLNWKLISIVAAVVIIVGLGAWLLFFRGSASPSTTNTGSFGTGTNNSTSVGTNTGTPLTQAGGSQSASSRVFEIDPGPVAGATFIQTLNPTTTVARYVLADNGHVMDLPVDSPGAVARPVSGTTIPGIQTVLWTSAGQGAVMQYLDTDGVTVKTVSFAFPQGTSTAVHINFLPDGIGSIAVSPAGTGVAYLLHTDAGSDVYTAQPDGTKSSKLFSLPLSQLLLSWPATTTILAQTPAAADTTGVLFAASTKTGAVSPILSAIGLTAIADPAFTRVLYQTAQSSGRVTYAHDLKSNTDTPLSFEPLPEQCVWSMIESDTAVCAAPISAVPGNFVDLWHQGVSSVADALIAFGPDNKSTAIAVPGSSDGGVPSDIVGLALSPDEHYLLFIKKGDKSLWGVRLTQ